MLLVDEFIRKHEMTFESFRQKIRAPLAESGAEAIVQAASLGEKIYFSPSTMLMLMEKLAHFGETIREVEQLGSSFETIFQRATSYRGAGWWIEFDKPIEQTAAMLCFIPSVYVPTGKDDMMILLINRFADPYLTLFSTKSGITFGEDHRCQKCTREYGVLILCEGCETVATVWGKIFGMSSLIAGQYLAAMKYEEKAFTGVRRVPRQGNEKKTKAVPVKHIFKVIDANEIIIQVPPEEKPTTEPRGSWIVEGEVVYDEIRTRPFERTYRHPRYVNMKGITVRFPEGITRMQPRKKDTIGKHVTKVKASLYEKEPLS